VLYVTAMVAATRTGSAAARINAACRSKKTCLAARSMSRTARRRAGCRFAGCINTPPAISSRSPAAWLAQFVATGWLVALRETIVSAPKKPAGGATP